MARASRHRCPERPREGEAGFALIEVVVSAAVLAMVAMAVLAGVDAASRSSGREKARSVAISLAEQDQERLRAMPASVLADGVADPAPITVGGATYRIDSEVHWVTDATGGTPSCRNNSDEASYLRIRSTVTSAVVGVRTAPVALTSLVTPPSVDSGAGEGTLIVQVDDRNGNGVMGVPVRATMGAQVLQRTTNEVGCAVFGRVPSGEYDVTLNNTGWVDDHGREPGQAKPVVSQNSVSLVTVKYDRAAPLTATFTTTNPKDGTTTLASQAKTLSASNSEAADPLVYTAANFAPTMSVKLFPFPTRYGSIYSGSCAASDPLTVVGSSYYTANPNHRGQVTTVPGASTPSTVNIHQPPMRLRIRNGWNGWVSDAVVKITGECPDETYSYDVTTDTTTGMRERGWVTNPASTNYDPGLPYGTYDVCARVPSGTGFRYGLITRLTLDDPRRGYSSWGSSYDLDTSRSSSPDVEKCP